VESPSPMHHCSIDLIGDLPVDNRGYRYILEMKDLFSNYRFLRPLKSKSADEVASQLFDIMANYGTPAKLSSDNGKEFYNNLLAAFHKMFGITQHFTPAYSPSTNGAVERAHKDTITLLNKYKHNVNDFWSDYLPLVQISLNSQICQRTKSTPFALMFARSFNGFEDFSNRLQQSTTSEGNLLDDFKLFHKQFHKSVVPAIEDRTTTVRSQARTQLDASRKIIIPFKVGEWVLVRNEHPTKLSNRFLGPSRIISISEHGVYTLSDVKDIPLSSLFTADKLRPYTGNINSVLHPTSDTSTTIPTIVDVPTSVGGGGGAEEEVSSKSLEYVEKIIKDKVGKDKSKSYLVKWLNKSDEYNEWVPAHEFVGSDMVQKYENSKKNNKKKAKKPLS